jgi:hypothetical protein
LIAVRTEKAEEHAGTLNVDNAAAWLANFTGDENASGFPLLEY